MWPALYYGLRCPPLHTLSATAPHPPTATPYPLPPNPSYTPFATPPPVPKRVNHIEGKSPHEQHWRRESLSADNVVCLLVSGLRFFNSILCVYLPPRTTSTIFPAFFFYARPSPSTVSASNTLPRFTVRAASPRLPPKNMTMWRQTSEPAGHKRT